MELAKPPIVFLGAGPVALASLQGLVNDFTIEAVISKPNPASSRAPRHVPAWAEEQGLTLFQPANKRELDDVIQSQQFTSKLGVVVDFGMIINQQSIDSFPLGIINSHFSLLPQWRGADPITFSLLSGQETTGVSVMQIVAALDEGDLLGQNPYTIKSDETIHSLTDNLVNISNTMLKDLLPAYISGQIKPYTQTETGTSFSRKLTKEDGSIDWNKSATEIEREIRAFLGWPSSYTNFGDIRVIITHAEIIEASGTAGKLFTHEKQPAVYCGNNALLIKEIKPSGKKAMDGKSFLNGFASRLPL